MYHQIYIYVSLILFQTVTHQQLPHLIGGLQLRVELTEDLIQVLTDYISQDIQSTPGSRDYRVYIKYRRTTISCKLGGEKMENTQYR